MKLQDVFDSLKYGEFSQLCIGGEDSGVINEKNYATILSHINLGMSALYTLFPLKQNRVTLQLRSDMEYYPITSAAALSNQRSNADIKYLLDTPERPFKDDIQKIEKVFTDSDLELSLNNSSDDFGVTTPSVLALQVPAILLPGSKNLPEQYRTDNLVLVYRAKPAKLVQSMGYFDPSRVDVELPDSHLEALLYFVASRVHNPIGMAAEFNASNNYYAKYLACCNDLKMANLTIDQGSQGTRLFRNGWV